MASSANEGKCEPMVGDGALNLDDVGIDEYQDARYLQLVTVGSDKMHARDMRVYNDGSIFIPGIATYELTLFYRKYCIEKYSSTGIYIYIYMRVQKRYGLGQTSPGRYTIGFALPKWSHRATDLLPMSKRPGCLPKIRWTRRIAGPQDVTCDHCLAPCA